MGKKGTIEEILNVLDYVVLCCVDFFGPFFYSAVFCAIYFRCFCLVCKRSEVLLFIDREQ
jgi:hypothetical protein